MRIKQVLEAIKDYGPMTQAEITEVTGIDPHFLSALMRKLSGPTKKKPQRVHIIRWVYDQPGARNYPRAVYALGLGSNRKKPKMTYAEHSRNYRERRKSILKTSSVFNLAVPLRCLASRSTPGTKIENSARSANTSERNLESTHSMAQAQ